MNQRSKRSRDRKREQNLGSSMMHTGGHVAAHGRYHNPVVRVPKKATGDVDEPGFAQASPLFKKMDEVLPKTKAEEKKVIAEATEKAESKVVNPKKKQEETEE